MDVLRQDLRFAVRSWGSRAGRGPALVTVLTLAVGIGAMTAIYSVVQAVLLRPLPVRDPERLVSIQVVMPEDRGRRLTGSLVNQNIYRAWREQTRALEDVGGFLGVYHTLTGLGRARSTLTYAVSANLFEMLGVRPTHGRGFVPDEERPGAPPVAVLSSTFAAINFGSDSGAVGRTVTLDGKPYLVIGIMPRTFVIPGGSYRVNPAGDIWTPLTLLADRQQAGAAPVDVLGYLAPGVIESRARAELDAILTAVTPPTDRAAFGKVTQLVSPHRMIVDDVRRPLILLAAAAAVLLAVACANVANMMLARAIARRREIALRTAIGAARARLVRQLLTESVALSLVGGVLGVLVAYTTLPVILALAGNRLPPVGTIAINAGVLAAALAVTIVVGLLVGLAPVMESRGEVAHSALKEGSANTTPSVWSRRASNGLIAGEVGLALVLLTAMGLIARSFIGVITLDRGYDTGSVAIARLGIPARYDSTPGARLAFRRRALEHLRSIPGITKAAVANAAPLLSSRATRLSTTGSQPTLASPFAETVSVSEDYFATLGIPVRRGRVAVADGEVMLDESAARLVFPDGDALGHRIDWGNGRDEGGLGSGHGIIVGVAGDIHEVGSDDDRTPRTATEPHLYRPLSAERASYFAVRGAGGDPARLFPALRAAFASIDPDITIDMGDLVDNMLRARYAQQRFLTQLMLGLASIALFLAAIGMYSVVSNAAERRTREIGIRVALGATGRDIIALVMRRAMIPVFVGLVVGLAGSVAATRFLRRLLFEVSPTDPGVLIGVTVVLCVATLVASYLPSRRATRIDPNTVLRAE
jgi:putative ABC transport system permease protein